MVHFCLGSRASNQTRTPPGHPDRARPVLPYGTIFGLARFQPNPDPTRPLLQACVDPILTGRAGPSGPNFLHILKKRVQFYLMVHFVWARALPT